MPTIQSIQPVVPVVWSDGSQPSRPDVFELEDGRIVRIACGGESFGRRQYSVWILNCLRWGVTPEQAVEGCCGNAWLTDSGSWELYPSERTTRSWCRSSKGLGIHKDAKATPREAALQMIAWSDHFTKAIHDEAQGGDSLVVKNWRVALLPEDPQTPRLPAFSRPGKHEVRLHSWRAFLVNKRDGGERSRVVVQAVRHPAGGYEARATVHAMARSSDGRRPADLTSRLNVPEYVLKFCLDRCYV